MKCEKVRYVPEANISFSVDDLRTLNTLSGRHYDYQCRAVSQPGGFLYGMTQRARLLECDTDTTLLKFDELDILAKITESERAPGLHAEIQKILQNLTKQWRLVNSGQTIAAQVELLANLIDEAHDVHIWDPLEDNHPAEGCQYCNAVRDAREALRVMADAPQPEVKSQEPTAKSQEPGASA
jgi:hypothetical protein